MSDTEQPPGSPNGLRGFQTFSTHSLPVHVLVYLGALALWYGIYAAVVLAVGSPDTAAANTLSGLRLRQLGAGVAGTVVGVYFVGAYARALGAPLLNFFAAGAMTVLMPARLLALGASPPDTGLFAGYSIPVMLAILPATAIPLLGIIAWYYHRFDGSATEAAKRWEAEHFPPGFRLAAVADNDDVSYGRSGGFTLFSFRKLAHASVVLVGMGLLYGVVVGLQFAVGEFVLLQALEETPWVLIVLSALCYAGWRNYRWRGEQETG